MHTQSPKIIHRDLTPYNILVKIDRYLYKKYVIKIADLGLACLNKCKDQKHTQTEEILAMGHQKHSMDLIMTRELIFTI